MRLIQFIDHNFGPCVGVVLEDSVLNVTEVSPALSSVVTAFREARRAGVRLAQSLESLIAQQSRSTLLDYSTLLASGQVLPPITENINYLYLAPSKLRTCSIGPELVTDFPFDAARVTCRVLRGESEIYHAGELCTGERNMCHSLANLEDHHFKFPQHRLPGDVHVHFFGTSKLSFPGRTWKFETDDIVEVAVEGLGRPLRNPIRRLQPSQAPVAVDLG